MDNLGCGRGVFYPMRGGKPVVWRARKSNKEDLDIITSVLLNLGLFGEKKESENALELLKRLKRFGKSVMAFIILNFISPRLWKELRL